MWEGVSVQTSLLYLSLSLTAMPLHWLQWERGGVGSDQDPGCQ